ncbi:glycosyltransferase family 2 protein [Arcanobacterium hippocoleae]|uniref:Glycosyltransferase involved in cell wall biosynthesis n=1 Tax=Arcanobacterium hippocoleae TaxID=149017 RepID=A0ABU1T3S0_9ACTO|nr:glycosyltransferase family 2 protein [Arcanobacterium hippocoleae]MDR6940032.1 glycosyltransferase involved in cell wall biosynthesis [Arcanobacterium hippocoleae]
MKKIISFVVPCYNSAAYMDACIKSLLGGPDIEVIIVNDGSTKDNTAEKADAWAARYPDIIRVVHQENAGHGGAVMAGLRAASGIYFKVVDSDDWLDTHARDVLLSKLRNFIQNEQNVDLVITNYVYEHVASGSQKVIRYRGALPTNRLIDWQGIGRFSIGQHILMHSATFRTKVLRDSGLELPKHTFYVDNIYVFHTLPHVKSLFYLPVDLYRYFIGREDQSVNESVMVGRLDQQMRVTKLLISDYHIPAEIESPKLAKYMMHFLSLIVAASSSLANVSPHADAAELKAQMWRDIFAHDEKMAQKIARNPLVFGANLKTPAGKKLAISLYRIAQKLYRFN